MKNVFRVLLIVGLFHPAIVFSQNWLQVGTGCTRPIRSMVTDTVLDYLYAGKDFSTQGTNSHIRWNSVQWDTLDDGCGGTPVISMTFYQNTIVAAGGCGVKQWNGTNWQYVGDSTASVLGVYAYNNDLYATGWFDTIGGVPASKIAKWNGTNWSAIDTTMWYVGAASCAIIYNGDLYMGGNMSNFNGSIDQLARWNGTIWTPVGNNEMASGIGGINCFEIYNGDLWMGGLFNVSPGIGIARWNGTQWLDQGGVINYPAQIFDMQLFDNELYIAGNFSSLAQMPIQCVAKWDGTDWCGSGSVFNNSVMALAVYNNELYIGGGFITVDGDTVNRVAKWNGGAFASPCGNTTGMHETENNIVLSVYPNPATDIITFQMAVMSISEIIITDQLGREVRRQKINNETSSEMSVADLASGMYFYRCIEKSGVIASGKFIVEH